MPLSRQQLMNIALITVALLLVGYLGYQMVLRSGLVRDQVTLSPVTSSGADREAVRELEIITVLGKDAIRAILDPRLVPAQEVQGLLRPEASVIGLSINGDTRAYPTATLSRHEIVNDVVGGVPVAVTW